MTLIGRTWSKDGIKTVEPKEGVVRMKLLFRRSALFYAEYNIRLFLKLVSIKPDVVYANDSDTLVGGGLAARVMGVPLVYDAHELFPDVPELMKKPFVRWVWRSIERCFIPRAPVRITVNQSVADEYERRYGYKFEVVRNFSERKSIENHQNFSKWDKDSNQHTLIYQGVINEGRCVKEVIDAMEYLPGCRFVVAGGGDLYEEMVAYAKSKKWGNRVQFTGRLDPEKLASLTRTATLGFCMMENLGLNYYYSLPNRISDYAIAGVPVIASDFPEIKRIVGKFAIGTMVTEETTKNPQELASTIKKTMAYWEVMDENERKRRFEEACIEMSWNTEKKRLIKAVDSVTRCNH